MQKLSRIEFARTFFFALLVILALAVLASLPRLAVPLTISYVIYLVISPVVPALRKMGMSKLWAYFTLIIGLIFFTSYPIVKVVPVIIKESQNVQYYIPKVEDYVRTEYSKIQLKVKDKTGYDLSDKMASDAIDYSRKTITSFLLSLPTFLASLLEWLFIVPLFVFFFLKDGKRFKRIFLRLAPNSLFERIYYLSSQFNKQIGDYIFAKFIEANIVGIIITTGLLFMDVKFPILLGVVAALTNVIPYLGPVLGTAPALVLVVVQGGVDTTFWAVLILYAVANIIDLAIVFPILVSKIVNLHPIIVVVSVIVGSQYLGVVGMIVSIPLAAAAKLIFSEIYSSLYGHHDRYL